MINRQKIVKNIIKSIKRILPTPKERREVFDDKSDEELEEELLKLNATWNAKRIHEYLLGYPAWAAAKKEATEKESRRIKILEKVQKESEELEEKRKKEKKEEERNKEGWGSWLAGKIFGESSNLKF